MTRHTGAPLRIAFTVVLSCLLVVGCASKATAPQVKPSVLRIGILPITDPPPAKVVNESSVGYFFPITAAALAIDSNLKSKSFVAKFGASNATLGNLLTAHLVTALKKEGFEAFVLEGVPRPPSDPDDVDFQSIKTDADAILQVTFSDIGVKSPFGRTDYFPRLNIRGALWSKELDDDLYGETLNYGADALKNMPWQVFSDPRYAYPSFEAVIAREAELREAFSAGVQAQGDRMALRIRAALR